MRFLRYAHLHKEAIYAALVKLYSAFLAAKDGHEVEVILKGILTQDERIKIGRRIQIAQYLMNGMSPLEVVEKLKVGRSTVAAVDKSLHRYPEAFELINKREEKVEREFEKRAWKREGSSLQVAKRQRRSGFSKKDVRR